MFQSGIFQFLCYWLKNIGCVRVGVLPYLYIGCMLLTICKVFHDSKWIFMCHLNVKFICNSLQNYCFNRCLIHWATGHQREFSGKNNFGRCGMGGGIFMGGVFMEEKETTEDALPQICPGYYSDHWIWLHAELQSVAHSITAVMIAEGGGELGVHQDTTAESWSDVWCFCKPGVGAIWSRSSGEEKGR